MSSVQYLPDLEWMQSLDNFTYEQQKVMLALSHEKYRWRSRDRLLRLTLLDPKTLDRTLSDLIVAEYVRPTFSKKRNIIFGIRERVG